MAMMAATWCIVMGQIKKARKKEEKRMSKIEFFFHLLLSGLGIAHATLCL